MKTLKLDEKDLEILNDVLWEIEESRVYEEDDDYESLQKLKDFFNYSEIRKYTKGKIELKE